MAGTRNYQSIGEVLVAVKTEFPDITISKIRFLESEGLITPERTPSGYRKFYVDDVDRLKSILRMQRDEYLPLKVIKERLVQCRRGRRGSRRRTRGCFGGSRDGASVSEELAEAPTGLQMSLEEMSAATGSTASGSRSSSRSASSARTGPRAAEYYDGDDYIVLSIVKDFLRYGVEPRHLTMYKHFADREAAFFEALVAPTLRQRNPDARRAADADARRSQRDVAEVQAGAAAQRTCATTSRPRESHRSAQRSSPARSSSRSCSRRGGDSRRCASPHGDAPPPDPRPARREPCRRSRQSLDDAARTPPSPPTLTAPGRAPGRPRHGPGPVREGRRRAGADRQPHEDHDGAARPRSAPGSTDNVTVDPDAVFERGDYGGGSRSSGCGRGSASPCEDLLYALLLGIANDAAVALAIHVAGSRGGVRAAT